ncbi:hypothetical protein DFH06DRAFT_1142870 [Mycena polygramma]|nr:hypothetical protein DFH06DRAFT_1142870 [Mycena polygramma]
MEGDQRKRPPMGGKPTAPKNDVILEAVLKAVPKITLARVDFNNGTARASLGRVVLSCHPAHLRVKYYDFAGQDSRSASTAKGRPIGGFSRRVWYIRAGILKRRRERLRERTESGAQTRRQVIKSLNRRAKETKTKNGNNQDSRKKKKKKPMVGCVLEPRVRVQTIDPHTRNGHFRAVKSLNERGYPDLEPIRPTLAFRDREDVRPHSWCRLLLRDTSNSQLMLEILDKRDESVRDSAAEVEPARASGVEVDRSQGETGDFQDLGTSREIANRVLKTWRGCNRTEAFKTGVDHRRKSESMTCEQANMCSSKAPVPCSAQRPWSRASGNKRVAGGAVKPSETLTKADQVDVDWAMGKEFEFWLQHQSSTIAPSQRRGWAPQGRQSPQLSTMQERFEISSFFVYRGRQRTRHEEEGRERPGAGRTKDAATQWEYF